MFAMQAPPMRGLEYLNAEVLAAWWVELDALVRAEAHAFPGGVQAWLREKNPLWRLVGRVTFHLAENKRDAERPFAFMATYATRLSAQARVQHLPLGKALQEYAGAKDRATLLSLLTPIQKAAQRSALVKDLVETGSIYHPLAWTPREAYRFLRDLPLFEESGLIVNVPDWWKAAKPPRPVVSVKVGEAAKSKLGVDALLEFSVGVTLDGETLTEEELAEAAAGFRRPGAAQGQMGRDRPGKTAAGAGTLEAGRSRCSGAASRFSKECDCWPGRRWPAMPPRRCRRRHANGRESRRANGWRKSSPSCATRQP